VPGARRAHVFRVPARAFPRAAISPLQLAFTAAAAGNVIGGAPCAGFIAVQGNDSIVPAVRTIHGTINSVPSEFRHVGWLVNATLQSFL